MSLAFLTAFALVVATPTGDARREAKARFGYAVLLRARELPAQALTQLEVAAKLDPESLEVARDRLRLFVVFGRYSDATRTARAILTRDPDDVVTAQTLAKVLHGGNDDAGAAKVLRAVLGRPGLAAPSLRRYGVLRDLATVSAADPAAREVALRGLVALMADEPALLVGAPYFDTPAELAAALAARREQLADALLAQQKFAEAETLYRTLRDTLGPARLAWNLSGLVLAQKRYPDGLKLLTGIAPEAGREEAYFDRLAELTRRTGSDAEAVRLLKAAAEARPRASKVWWVYASALGEQDAAAGARLFGELSEVTADPAFLARFVGFYSKAGRAAGLLDAVDALADRVAPRSPEGVEVGPLRADDAGRDETLARLRALVAAIKADAASPGALAQAGAAGYAGRHPLTQDLLVWCAERANRSDLIDAVLAPAARGGNPAAIKLYYTSLCRQRKWREAVELCDDAEARGDKRDGVNWKYLRARPLVELGRGADALRMLDAAARSADQKFTVRVTKAETLTRLDRPREALTLLAAIVAEFPNPDVLRQAQMAQAAAHSALREFAAADALYETLLDDPQADEVLVLNNYAYHLADDGRKLDQAEAMLRRALELDREEARRAGRPEAARGTYLDSLGWVLFRRGKLAEAREVFVAAMATLDGANDPTVWDHAGDVYAHLGEVDAARAAWTTALKLSENTQDGRSKNRRDELAVKLGQLGP